jgi:hypothetical protein
VSIGSSTPFQPVTTVALTSSTASANIQLIGSGETVLITNSAPSLAFVRFGSDPTVQATIPTVQGTPGDTPVLPNTKLLLRCGPIVSYCAAILNSGSGTVMFTRGDGSSS